MLRAWSILPLMLGCGQEYSLEWSPGVAGGPPCERVDELLLCQVRVEHSVAAVACDLHGRWLVDVSSDGDPDQVDLDQWGRVWREGEAILGGSVFWTGWPGDWECPAMNGAGSAVQGHDCEDAFPFVCELAQ